MSREKMIAANPIVEFVRHRGHELKAAGENFVTNGCPKTPHKRGHRPTMIYPQTQSWTCHDCKIGRSVIDWVIHEKGVSATDAIRILSGGNSASEPVATYDYTNEEAKLLFQTCRYQPKDFKQRRPDGKGGWIWNLKGVRRVLYRLPEVLKAQTVVIAEGEKDCDNLRSLGFTATTNPCGAGKWRPEYGETLRGKDAVIFGDVGDADGAGERHTAQVIQSLSDKAKSIKHVKLPDGFHDVSNYIESLPKEKAAQAIRKLIDEAPEIEAQPSSKPMIKAATLLRFLRRMRMTIQRRVTKQRSTACRVTSFAESNHIQKQTVRRCYSNFSWRLGTLLDVTLMRLPMAPGIT